MQQTGIDEPVDERGRSGIAPGRDLVDEGSAARGEAEQLQR